MRLGEDLNSNRPSNEPLERKNFEVDPYSFFFANPLGEDLLFFQEINPSLFISVSPSLLLLAKKAMALFIALSRRLRLSDRGPENCSRIFPLTNFLFWLRITDDWNFLSPLSRTAL